MVVTIIRVEMKRKLCAEIKIGYSVRQKSVNYSLRRKISKVFKASKIIHNRETPFANLFLIDPSCFICLGNSSCSR